MELDERAQRTVKSVLEAIPGYKGYRQKEDRRDADRRVREVLALKFGAQADRIERIAGDVADQRRLRDIGPIDEFARSLRHLIDRIATATYGYGGLFGDRDVDERALDQIRQFDESLMTGVEELEQPIADLERAYAVGSDLAAPARAGSAVVRDLLARFDLRSQVVETAEPAPPESVLKYLQPTPAETAPDAYDLHERDAISILGENYVIDARIDVAGTPDVFRLFRIGEGPESWLYVPKETGQPFELLHPAKDQDGEDTEIDGVMYTVQSSGSGTGSVIGAGGRSGEEQVAYRLLAGADDSDARAVVLIWYNERQVFVGNAVHPRDVEIFRSKYSAR